MTELLLILATLLLLLLLWQRQQRLQQQLVLLEKMQQTHFDQALLFNLLKERLQLLQGLPYTPKWSAAPDFLQIIVNHALTRKPRVVVECSSGLTTLMLARCCQLNSSATVKSILYSLENGSEYATISRSEVARYGLSAWAEVVDAPLGEISVAGECRTWYSLAALPQNLVIDMLVIDGPPAWQDLLARFPALPLLYSRLADGATLFLDDAGRDGEREVVRQWLARYPETEFHQVATQRGCAILTIHKTVQEHALP
ncbi:MAG: class I SAM-dependent methyltransferase [Gammaproteobacteria bacterium]|nr:class I SAM-dependent methyltransferase [Gammaproteobacteria bacterium]